jgi:hypothetical protein
MVDAKSARGRSALARCRLLTWMPAYAAVASIAAALLQAVPAAASVAVSSGGQANTGYPIAVPPGIAGMAPNLSLSYADGGVNGPVGVGWSVQGISVITRCPATRPTDGSAKAVEFVAADKLCLDGQRLIQTDTAGAPLATQTNDALGLDGSAVREYRTEKDSFARIRAYGTAGGTAGNGPAYFKVWTKSGQVYEYGRNPSNSNDANALVIVNAPNRSEVAVWAVRKISDVAGNYIEFKYEHRDTAWGSGTASGGATGREWNIAQIRYTGNGSQLPQNKVIFDYEDRAADAAPGLDRSEAYQFNSKNVSIRRLSTIRTYINSPGDANPGASAIPVRTLKLAYARSPVTGRSRVTSITECAAAGGVDDPCLPPTTYAYRDTSAVSFGANATFALKNLNMLDATTGQYGILTGDFDGDGRTDILRWGGNPANNELWLSRGNGAFENQSASFNLKQTEHVLFRNDGCFHSIVADFNGDGLSDVLRTVVKSGCNPSTNVLYLSSGNGAFTAVTLPSSIVFGQSTPQETVRQAECVHPYRQPAPLQPLRRTTIPIDTFGDAEVAASRTAKPSAATPSPTGGLCWEYTSTIGQRYYILDVNGDGLPDIVTTVVPSYRWNTGWGPVPTYNQLCEGWAEPYMTPHSGPCTRVFLGQPNGGFQETSTNVAYTTLFTPPTGSLGANPYWRMPDQADIDGDGLQDILSSYTGRWRSLGNGNFAASSAQDSSQECGLPIDFNGDGRADCLRPNSAPTSQFLTLSYGASSSGALAQFNLNTSGHHLYAADGHGRQNVGVVVEDFDGDGRQDILRWGPTPSTDNGIYFSRGDGSFSSTRVPAGLTSIPGALQAADGSSSFVLGDFLGNGTVQILHLKSNPPASGGTADNTNQLYARSGTVGPVDVLASITSPTGLVSTVGARVPLTVNFAQGGNYVSDRVPGIIGSGAIVDLQPPMYVIASVQRQTGAGTPLTTRYLYKGLKVERGGRGMLGFREVQQEDPTPDGQTLNVVTEYLLSHPYNGVAKRTRTFLAALGSTPGTPLSTTTNVYCDRTTPHNAQGAPNSTPTVDAPCTAQTPAKVTRPYLWRSVEEGRDLNGAALPKVTTTNTYNDFGDPTKILVQTEADFAGANRTYTTLTENTFCAPDSANCPNKVDGDQWILGRLTRATVTNTVHDVLSTLTASAGTSPTATAITGSPPPGSTQAINPAALSAILQLLLDD